MNHGNKENSSCDPPGDIRAAVPDAFRPRGPAMDLAIGRRRRLCRVGVDQLHPRVQGTAADSLESRSRACVCLLDAGRPALWNCAVCRGHCRRNRGLAEQSRVAGHHRNRCHRRVRLYLRCRRHTKAIPARCRTDPSSRHRHSASSRVCRLHRDHAAPGGRSAGRREDSTSATWSSAAPTFIVGDVLGIAVTTPLVLRFARRWREQTLHLLVARIPEFAVFVVVIIIALWLIARTATADGYTLFYLLFFPVVVGAVRHGLDGACLTLAATQFGLVGLLHHHGYDWRIFTEFQVLMFVLTATGLIVGVVVSERQATERIARESEARLKEKEAEVAHAARFSLVSGMATALAHEINQPMAAARALGRSVQELLRNPQADLKRADQNLTRLIAEIDLAGGILRRMRDFLRRGRPQISTINVPLMLDDTLMLIRPEATSKHVEIDLDCPVDLPVVYRRPDSAPASRPQSSSQCRRLHRGVGAVRWSHPVGGDAFGQLGSPGNPRPGQWTGNSGGSGRAPVHAAHDFKEGRIGSWSLHLPGDCRSAWRPHLASFE